VASQLLRLGHVVTLTLGQTKEIDLLVETRNGREVTVDVKGLKNKTNWPLRLKQVRPNHFYILVTYADRFEDLSASPETFVIPANRIRKFIGKWSGSTSGQTDVSYRRVKRSRYREAWHLLR